MNRDERLDYLESERQKIWEKLSELQIDIQKKSTDHETDSRNASKMVTQYKNKSEKAASEAEQCLTQIKQSLEEFTRSSQDISSLKITTQARLDEIIAFANQVDELHKRVVTTFERFTEEIEGLDTILEREDELRVKVNNLEDQCGLVDDLSTKINQNLNHSIAKRKEIDGIYYDIVGYLNDGVEVPGLKHELENSYNQLKTELAEYKSRATQEFQQMLGKWQIENDTLAGQVKALLPKALTAGLSAAYTEKKEAEIKESTLLEGRFKNAIIAMVLVSLIPFAASIWFLATGAHLDETILKMPRLVLAIIPLYIPVLWIAYSTNKKINLSKRLIEEYTHKEVLSKTFEGLSSQIENIKNTNTSTELKTRLLYNLLEVSAENPGKLISNYDKSDHPLMDALDKSVLLFNAVEKVANIPGMNKFSKILQNKADIILEENSKKANKGLDCIES